MVDKPTVLALEECAIPDQDWVPYSEAVIALIVGGSGSDFKMEDSRLTGDALELAEAALSRAAYQGAVHFYGYKGEKDEIAWRNSERIKSSLFDRTRKKIIHLSGDDQIQIGNSIWSGVYIDARSLRSWIERELKAKKQAAKPAKHVMTGTADLIRQAQQILEPIYKAIPATAPLPNEDDDWKRVDVALEQHVSRDKVLRPARKKAAHACGREFKAGRPSAVRR